MTRERHQPGDATMSFGDHLEDLRRRVFLSLIAPVPLAFITFFFSARLIEILLDPLFRVQIANNLPRQVQVLSPPEFLVTQIKLSIIAALVLSAPWIVYQGWKFIGPGLYRHEKRFVYFLLPGSAILTTAGVSLLYFIMLPLMLQVLVMFGSTLREPAIILQPGGAASGEVAPADLNAAAIEVRTEAPESPAPGQMWLQMPERELYIAVAHNEGIELLHVPLGSPSAVAQQFRLSEYISFVLILLLGIVIAFQMPLVIVLLGWIGLVTTTWLRRNRKYALFICAIVAAVITPAEAVSMIAMLIPLYALYELGILLLWIAPAKRVAAGTVLRSELSGNETPQTDHSRQTSGSPWSVHPEDSSRTEDDEHSADQEGPR